MRPYRLSDILKSFEDKEEVSFKVQATKGKEVIEIEVSTFKELARLMEWQIRSIVKLDKKIELSWNEIEKAVRDYSVCSNGIQLDLIKKALGF